MEDGVPKILGGTKEIQMRLGAVELYFPELYKKIEQLTEMNISIYEKIKEVNEL